MNFTLTPTEARVLGALIEKEITTSEYYPLSLNAILNATNQKSNRDPVMDLDEETVRRALHSLNQQNLARSAATDSRVPKFEHRLAEVFNFHRHEIALLCVLLLRGPQTPGELRTRTDRLYQFEDLNAVHSALNLLMNRQPSLVKILPRQPGTKEARYTQLLTTDSAEADCSTPPFAAPAYPETRRASPSAPDTSSQESPTQAQHPSASIDSGRLAHLEQEVAALRSELADLKIQFASFQKQFQ